MQLITPSRSDRHVRSQIVGTVVGACLVAAGLSLAFATLQTPLVTTLVPASRTGTTQAVVAFLIGALAVIAGASLLVAGTSRLASIIATLRGRPRRRSPVVAALGTLPPDLVVATDVVPTPGRPIPELVVGPFGVAVIHELGGRSVIRQIGTTWERRTRDGWVPTEHPLDRAERDAERVRHWLTHGDLDFVVRVHAALITPDASMMRSPLCAVITERQIPAWLAALPSQRSLTEGRRQQVAARVRAAVPTTSESNGRPRDW
jgi:type IV secretory pathway protease TraF